MQISCQLLTYFFNLYLNRLVPFRLWISGQERLGQDIERLTNKHNVALKENYPQIQKENYLSIHDRKEDSFKASSWNFPNINH